MNLQWEIIVTQSEILKFMEAIYFLHVVKINRLPNCNQKLLHSFMRTGYTQNLYNQPLESLKTDVRGKPKLNQKLLHEDGIRCKESDDWDATRCISQLWFSWQWEQMRNRVALAKITVSVASHLHFQIWVAFVFLCYFLKFIFQSTYIMWVSGVWHSD